MSARPRAVPGRAREGEPSAGQRSRLRSLPADVAVDTLLAWAWKHARYHARRHTDRYGFDPADAEDLASDVVVDVLRRAIPRYDPARGGMKPYLRWCIHRSLSDHLDALVTRRLRHRLVELDPELMSAGRSDDDVVTDLADRIRQMPELFFTATDARVLRALLDRRMRSKTEIANELDLTPAKLSRAIARLRDRVRQIAEVELW